MGGDYDRWEYKVEVQLCSFLLRGRQGGHDDLVGDVGRGGDRRATTASLVAKRAAIMTLIA